MQALREQVFVAPRYVSQSPSPRPIRSSPTRAPRTPRTNVPQSRVLSALAAMNTSPSTAEPRPAHPFLFPHTHTYNAGREHVSGVSVSPAFPSSSRGIATLSAPPVMEPPGPVPQRRSVTHARLSLSSGTDVAMSGTVNLADTKESEPPPEEAPVEEPAPTKPPYSYKDYTPEAIRIYTRCVDEVNDHLPMLHGPLGFDMEWKVTYRRQQAIRPTAVVQICDERYIWIIQVSAMRRCFPLVLKKMLENPDVPKIGVNIRNDATKLYKDFGVKMQNLVELSFMSRQADKTLRLGGKLHARSPISLQNLVGGYLGKHLVKDDARVSDWEKRLNNKQLEYAASDVHCALQLYKHFLTMAKDDGVELTPDWYTFRVREDGECILKEEPPAPVSATTKKSTTKAENAGAPQVSEESATLTEQATEIEKPKPVQRKASPHARSSRSSKASASPSPSSLKSSASTWPPRRPIIRTRKKLEPVIVEIPDLSSLSSDGSTLQPASTQPSRARQSRQSPVLPRTAVVDHPSPSGEAVLSGRRSQSFHYAGSTAAPTTSSGKALSARAKSILKALEED